MEVKFYDSVDDGLLRFAVILSRSNGKWVFCKHKERNTYEVPGGHREENEAILETAKRELKEETGAARFHIEPVCVYSVTGKTGSMRQGKKPMECCIMRRSRTLKMSCTAKWKGRNCSMRCHQNGLIRIFSRC